MGNKLLVTYHILRERRGQSVIEVLVALGVFTLGVASVWFLVLDALVSQRIAGERIQAIALAEEGLEAARSIRDNNFSGLAAGPHGITLVGNRWEFFGVEDSTGKFSRVVTVVVVSSTRRDLTSTVTWQASPERQESILLFTRFTNWR